MALVCVGIATWKVLHLQQWITLFPKPPFATLHAIQRIAWTLQQILVLVLAVLYWRLLRWQAPPAALDLRPGRTG